MKRNKHSSIVALRIISESEIVYEYPEYEASWEKTRLIKLENILYSYGLDTTKSYERQDGLWHRNGFGKIVLCSRYVGQERQDPEWITSGYASQEAKDKYSGSRLLEDIYRARRLTEDTQAALEARDRYKVIDPEYD